MIVILILQVGLPIGVLTLYIELDPGTPPHPEVVSLIPLIPVIPMIPIWSHVM